MLCNAYISFVRIGQFCIIILWVSSTSSSSRGWHSNCFSRAILKNRKKQHLCASSSYVKSNRVLCNLDLECLIEKTDGILIANWFLVFCILSILNQCPVCALAYWALNKNTKTFSVKYVHCMNSIV